MKQLDVLDQTGKKVGTVDLNAAIFEAPLSPALVAQAIRVRMINARLGTAQAQTRAEVRGGGRKPWKQKGTGRARHGSTRSPIWTGGGVAHGPRAHKPEAAMPQSMRRAALFSALTDKLQRNGIIVVDHIALEQPKTKLMSQVMAALPVGKKSLVIIADKDKDLVRSSRNLQDVRIMSARVLHPYDVLRYQTIVFIQDGLKTLEDTFAGSAAEVIVEETPVKKTAAPKTTTAKAAKPSKTEGGK